MTGDEIAIQSPQVVPDSILENGVGHCDWHSASFAKKLVAYPGKAVSHVGVGHLHVTSLGKHGLSQLHHQNYHSQLPLVSSPDLARGTKFSPPRTEMPGTGF